MEHRELTNTIVQAMVDLLPDNLLNTAKWVVGTESTEKFWVVNIWVEGKEAGFVFPKKYCNLWPLRVERAVRETLENLNLLP